MRLVIPLMKNIPFQHSPLPDENEDGQLCNEPVFKTEVQLNPFIFLILNF